MNGLVIIILGLANVSEVQSLIDRGVRLNYEYMEKDEEPNQYPLHYAIGQDWKSSTFESVRRKLFYIYRAMFISLYIWVVLSFSLDFNEEIFKLLIRNGANLETVNAHGYTPL